MTEWLKLEGVESETVWIASIQRSGLNSIVGAFSTEEKAYDALAFMLTLGEKWDGYEIRSYKVDELAEGQISDENQGETPLP